MLPLVALGAAGVTAIVAAVFGAYFFAYPELPPAETIRDIPLQVPMRVFSRDGLLITEFGDQRRIPVTYDEIPNIVVEALLAAEDDRFFQHPGIDYQGLLRAVWKLALTGKKAQGGSTLTMQLARDYFLSRDPDFSRKIREIFLAYRIEQEFSKEEILALFLNKMFFGQRAYGIAAAAQVFFDKELADLNAAEAATLVGILAAPSRYNPVSGPDASKNRRSYVLRRMHELDFLDDAEYQEASEFPLVSELHGPDVELHAPFLAEVVRQDMLREFGEEIYSAGYQVYTTLDSKLQSAAVLALRNGLLEYDRRHGYRGVLGKLPADAVTAGNELTPEARQAMVEFPQHGGLLVAVVQEFRPDQSVIVRLRDESEIRIPFSGLSWAREYVDDDLRGPEITKADEVLAVGDIIYTIPTADGQYALAQLPQVQGAFVAVDPDDGAVVALQGGFDFRASKFNRAMQIERQPGSTFKPFVYSAALESGMTAATIINDSPIVIESEELETTWRPLNYGGRFHGPTRMREALYRSFNLVSVRILLRVGLPAALEHLKIFSFSGTQVPRDTSLALGSGAMSPLHLAMGYTVFANGGYKVEPYYIDTIYDANGIELKRADPAVVCRTCVPSETAKSSQQPVFATADDLIDRADKFRPTADQDADLYASLKIAQRVLDERNVFIVSDMMRDVINRGTGVRARQLNRTDLSGKTGTSNDRRDAWFAGFNADLVATTWVGFDSDRPLGGREEGSRTALPIWIHFMETALDGVANHMQPQPAGMTTVRISAETGELATSGDSNAIFETFREEYAPKPKHNNDLDPNVFDPFNSGASDEGVTDDPLF